MQSEFFIGEIELVKLGLSFEVFFADLFSNVMNCMPIINDFKLTYNQLTVDKCAYDVLYQQRKFKVYSYQL